MILPSITPAPGGASARPECGSRSYSAELVVSQMPEKSGLPLDSRGIFGADAVASELTSTPPIKTAAKRALIAKRILALTDSSWRWRSEHPAHRRSENCGHPVR